jgi:hypothetical protein
LPEDTPDHAFRFANIFIEDFRTFDGEEVEICFSGEDFGNEGFGAAGRIVEEDPFRG